MEVVVDRITDTTAFIETKNGDIVEIDVSVLPKGCIEGDVLFLENGSYRIDTAKTKKQKKEAEDLLRFFKNNKRGDRR